MIKLVVLTVFFSTITFTLGRILRTQEVNCLTTYEGHKIIKRTCHLKDSFCDVQLDDGSVHVINHHTMDDKFVCADEVK